MDIKVQKQGDVAVRDQLVAQIVFLIATSKLKPGEALPSVRSLARQLNIHHNTISEAYQDLVDHNFLTRRRGTRMVVRIPERSQANDLSGLDDVIDETLRMAHQRGYSIWQLAHRFRQRLSARPPDHILALSPDAGLRRILEAELCAISRFEVRSCSPEDVVLNPALANKSLVVSPLAYLPVVLSALPATQPLVPIVLSTVDRHLDLVRQLVRPSIIAVVSVSERFLEIARGLLSPMLGAHHSLVEHLLERDQEPRYDTADLLFCDMIALGQVPGLARKKAVVYRLISPDSLVQIASAMGISPRAAQSQKNLSA